MNADDSHVLSLVLKNEADELTRLSDAADEFADRIGLADAARFELQLCLEEAVMNVVNYGFHDAEEHDIEVELRLDSKGDALLLRIVDDGTELDHTEGAEPDLDAFLEDQAMGGLGFHLLRRYADDLSYYREDGRNHLVLTKAIAPNPLGSKT